MAALESPSAVLEVDAAGARLRSGVALTSAAVGVLTRGARCTMLDFAGERVRVRSLGGDRIIEGWASRSLFRAVAAAPGSGGEWETPVARPWTRGDSLAPFVVAPAGYLDEALDLAAVGAGDVVLDLGCGDGRIPCAAMRRGARRAGGIELDESLVRAARRNAARRNLSKSVEILRGDLTRLDAEGAALVAGATVLTVFLLPSALAGAGKLGLSPWTRER